MGEVTRECWKCDVCGFEFIKGLKEPYRCPSQTCRSVLWNRPRKSVRGRPDKGMVRVKARMSPTLDAQGGHHPLCACLLCLTEIARGSKPVKGHPKGLGEKGATGRRNGVWKVKIAPRTGYEANQLRDALIRG